MRSMTRPLRRVSVHHSQSSYTRLNHSQARPCKNPLGPFGTLKTRQWETKLYRRTSMKINYPQRNQGSRGSSPQTFLNQQNSSWRDGFGRSLTGSFWFSFATLESQMPNCGHRLFWLGACLEALSSPILPQ